jgi:hypothetical protein
MFIAIRSHFTAYVRLLSSFEHLEMFLNLLLKKEDDDLKTL